MQWSQGRWLDGIESLKGVYKSNLKGQGGKAGLGKDIYVSGNVSSIYQKSADPQAVAMAMMVVSNSIDRCRYAATHLLLDKLSSEAGNLSKTDVDMQQLQQRTIELGSIVNQWSEPDHFQLQPTRFRVIDTYHQWHKL